MDKSKVTTVDARAVCVVDAIDKLGDSPDAIAVSLKKLGCRGKPRSCQHCPLAKYLRAELPDQVCHVFPGRVRMMTDTSKTISIYNSVRVDEFIKNFDNEKYPELLEAE